MVPDKKTILDIFDLLHKTPETRAVAIAKLRAFERQETMRELGELFAHENQDTVCDAARITMMLDSKQGTKAVVSLMKHPSGTVRWCACSLFHDYASACDLGDGVVLKELVNALLADQKDNVRLMAADALGNIGDLAALPALQHAAENDKGEDWEGRTVADAARRAIERITTPPKPRWS